MPYDIGTNACLQIQFEGRQAAQQVMTVMTYVYSGEEVEEDGPLVIDEIDVQVKAAGGLYDRWRDCLSEDVQVSGRFYQWIHPIRYAYIAKIPAVAEFGKQEEQSFPPNVSQAITRQTNFAGREEVSTLKLPGVPLSAVGAGFILDPQMLILNDFAQKSVQEIVLGSGSKMVPIPWNRTSPGTANQLRTAYAHNTARVMRRRSVGLGS